MRIKIVYLVSLDKIWHRTYSVGSDSHFLLSGRWITWIREFPCSGPVFVCLSHISLVLPCLYCGACIYPWGLFTKLKESVVCFCICTSPWSCSAAFHGRFCFGMLCTVLAACFPLGRDWLKRAACCCSSLSQAPGWSGPVVFANCILSTLSAFGTTVTGEVFWSSLGRKRSFLKLSHHRVKLQCYLWRKFSSFLSAQK